MKIAEYKQVDTKIETTTVLVDDFDEMGEIVGQHEETVTKEIPVMGMVYREMTPEEEAEALKAQAEAEEYERTRPRTAEEQIETLKAENEMLMECLLEMSEIVYA